MSEELARFVASLAIPEDRKAVVLAELSDHVACARESAARDGRDPDAAARAALGDLAALRRSLEAVEPAFRVSRWHAIARGAVASLVIALLIDRLGSLWLGSIAVLASLAVAVVAAPPRTRELLRAELRVKRVPIGPALAYLFTVISGPFVVWIALIVERGLVQGITHCDVPWSAFAVNWACWLLLIVEAIRARVLQVA